MDYDDFIRSKVQTANQAGFEVDPKHLHAALYPHQHDAVCWALRMGRALIAKSFGLGKTRIQCEIARQLVGHFPSRPFMLVCPLGVKHQFTEEDGPAMGIRWQYVRTDAEVQAADTPYLITNYERIREGNITPALHNLCGVSLDEGSVLRSLGSKTYDIFNRVFAAVEYRYVCTATPAPNRYKEIIHYAEFLSIMDRGQALTRWFKRDSQKAGNLTIHPHHERDFWLWVSSWALFLHTPGDLGYDDTGYVLPELKVHWHRIEVDHTRAFDQVDSWGQRKLILDAASGVREASAEKRETIEDRVKVMEEIMDAAPADTHWLLWHHLEAERHAISRAVKDATVVYGSQALELREQRILDFSHGRVRILATKPQIAGSGCNFQRHCHSNIFLGVNYEFQDFIQAVHRTQRFQQKQPVDVHIIYAASEDAIADTLKAKWEQHNLLVEKMRGIIREYGMSHTAIEQTITRSIGMENVTVTGECYTAMNDDCTVAIKGIESDSIGLIHTSIPFGNHYEYTAQYEDYGHNQTDGHFWEQMDFLIPELLRVTKPGRCAAIHVKDRILYGHQTESGFMEVSPFSDECVTAFRKHGWMFESRRTIVTDVVRENASTYRLGWTEMTNDASKMGSGLPEYLLLFRRPPSSTETARADEPVTKDKADFTRARWQVDAHSYWRSDGNTHLPPQMLYDYEDHIKRLEVMDKAGHLPSSYFYEPPPNWGHPAVWDDVQFMHTLNTEQSRRCAEQHICPLPIDIVDRAIRLYSNAGDTVLDPFSGLFTVPARAVKHRRQAIGIELNAEYFACGVAYTRQAEEEIMAPTLFDLAEIECDTDNAIEPAEAAQ